MEIDKNQFGGSDIFSLTNNWNEEQVKRLPARTLAYIGDAIYETALRLAHVRSSTDKSGRLHDSLVKIVCSSAQARLYDVVFSELTESEQALVKCWKNSKQPQNKCGSGTRAEYAKSTAIEAWVAYLFLTGQTARLQKIIQQAANWQPE